MSTTPVTQTPDPDELEKKLNFARQIATEEIKNVERLHDKTIRSLTVLMAGFSLVFVLIGFVGFNNLRDFAVVTATNKMNETISRLMEEKKVEGIVDGLIATVAKDSIDRQVAEKVRTLGPEIQKAAVAEARRMVAEPRHLTRAQKDAITSASQPYRGRGFKVLVRAYSEVPEEKHYANEIMKALNDAGWITRSIRISGGYGGDAILPDVTGMFIALDHFPLPLSAHPELTTNCAFYGCEGAIQLQAVFKAAGMNVPIESGESMTPWFEDGKPSVRVPTLIISSKF
jgi:hypothetical protein